MIRLRRESSRLMLLDTMRTVAFRTNMKTPSAFRSIRCFRASCAAVEPKTNCLSRRIGSRATQFEDMMGYSNLALSSFLATLGFEPGFLHLQMCSFATLVCGRLGSLQWAWSAILLCYQWQQGKGHPVTLETLHELRIQ